jgi:hypothetical protein
VRRDRARSSTLRRVTPSRMILSVMGAVMSSRAEVDGLRI